MLRKSILQGTLLLATSLIAVSLLGEGITRFFGGVRYGGWGDPASIRLVSKQFTRNSKGLRGREVSYQRAPGELRILCLGDSYTWGQMVREEETWPKVLERKMNLAAGDSSVTVINSGHLGWNTADEYRWYAAEGVRYRPDIVLVGFCLNDAETDHYGLSPLLPGRLERFFSRSYFYFFLKYRLHLLKVRFGLVEGYDDYIRGLYRPDRFGWMKNRRALRLIDETARANGAKCALMIFPMITDWDHYAYDQVHQEIARFCNERGIPFRDLFRAFRQSDRRWEDLRVGPSDGHPNAEGHRIIARAAGELVAELGRRKKADGR